MHGSLINPKSDPAEVANLDQPFDGRFSRRERARDSSDWRNAAAVLYAVSPGIVFFAAVMIHILLSG